MRYEITFLTEGRYPLVIEAEDEFVAYAKARRMVGTCLEWSLLGCPNHDWKAKTVLKVEETT